jgi:hypothetical protein
MQLVYWVTIHISVDNPRTRTIDTKLMLILRVKNYPAFHGTRRFITMFTRARHSHPDLSESNYIHPIYSRSILVLSSSLNLDTYQARSKDDYSDVYSGAVRFDQLTIYPESGVSCSSSMTLYECRNTASLHIFFNRPFINYATIRRYTVWDIKSIVKYTINE